MGAAVGFRLSYKHELGSGKAATTKSGTQAAREAAESRELYIGTVPNRSNGASPLPAQGEGSII